MVQDAGMKSTPKKKKYKRAKWLSEEALQIFQKKGEANGKGERERYTHLNEKFQRIERRDKKDFLSDQCKEIEENKRMGGGPKMAEEQDGETTFSPTNSSKEHLNAE